MTIVSRPLLELTAADLMSPTVVTIPEDMSLRVAARVLAKADVSGAPVVDAAGRCVGVLSVRDYVAWAERREHSAKPKQGPSSCYCAAWQMLNNDDAVPTDVVRCAMTADPVTIAPTTSIGVLARMMIDARIHRVIVLDAAGCPVGVVSSTDVLAAVARAAQVHGIAAGAYADAAGEDDHDPFYPRAT